MMSVECVAIFWVVNASSGEKSCLQFSIPTGSGTGWEGGVSHSLNIWSGHIAARKRSSPCERQKGAISVGNKVRPASP